MRTPRLLATIVAGTLILACGGERLVSPTPDDASLAVTAAAVQNEPISGSIEHSGEEPPGGVVVTPSGRCHFFDVTGHGVLTGDVEGPIAFRRQVLNLGTCGAPPSSPGDRITGSGPVDGMVTYDGRAGAIAGQWTTECRPDASQPSGFSCDGTMVLRGSGDLEGIRFHMKWGPGWWPFPYEGTAVSQ